MATNSTKLYQADQPPKMRFQARDEDVLKAIYRYGGVLAKRQLKELFWPDKTWRAMEKRLSKLYRAGYIDWPARDKWRSQPVPEPICWLGWKGALWLARDLGANVEVIQAENESQKRKLDQNLRKSGFHWLREPRWIQLKHDLRIVDFMFIIEKSVRLHPSLNLGEWVLEREFRSNPDIVEYENPRGDSQSKRSRKAVIPDCFFSIQNQERLIEGQPYTARFLVEIDMSTEDNPRFAREKLAPSIAYIRSTKYKERFGYKSGRWLVVANSNRRLENLKQQAESMLGKDASIFYFATFENLVNGMELTSPVWHRGGNNSVGPLLEL